MLEIRPSQPRGVEFTGSVVQILNDHANKHGYEEITVAEFMTNFEVPVEECANEGTQKLKVSSHCELTLALHFYETMTSNKRFMEMGVSKGCCWLCEQFLEILAMEDKKMVVEGSNNQGKLHAGWGMPAKTLSHVSKKILEIIDHELCDIRVAVIGRRKSDLFPATSDRGEPLAPTDEGDTFMASLGKKK